MINSEKNNHESVCQIIGIYLIGGVSAEGQLTAIELIINNQ